MSQYQQIADKFAKNVMGNYRRYPLVITRGEGSYVWDENGKRYLDLFPGWGVSGIGHCHPLVVSAIQKQAATIIHIANNYYTIPQGDFAEILVNKSQQDYRVFFCNSGTEATEGAIKLARKSQSNQNKYKIITLIDSFHGRSYAGISATGQDSMRDGFTPILPGFTHAPINDIAAVEKLIDDETAAIMVEPVQGEAGVYPCSKEFLTALRALCDDKKILLIFDEVQTTPLRLGEWFGFQYFGVVPDILTSAKSVAGGMPVGFFMGKAEIAAALKPGSHGSTYGGNALGCAAGIAAYQAMESEHMRENVRELTPYLTEKLQELKNNSAILGYRQLGFMVGIDLAFPGANVVDAAREKGLLINCTHDTILRLLPAFNITKSQIDSGFELLTDSISLARSKM